MSKRRIFWRNLAAAFSAQGVALFSSLAMSLLVPKALGVEAFSYWQLFVFYSSYAGFFHLGLTDGIYLRLGGQKFDSIDFPLLASQMRYALAFQALVGAIISAAAWKSEVSPDRLFVIISAAIYIASFNLFAYVGMILQATNRMATYSFGLIMDRLMFLGIITVALFHKGADFRILVLGQILCRLVAVGYFWYQARPLFRARGTSAHETLAEIWVNIRVGVNLMLANVAGALVLGAGRQIIDMRWGITTFGKVSLALSIMVFVLQFVGQISLVLYPALAQTTLKRQLALAAMLRSALDVGLPAIFLTYVPMSILLNWWLPEYAQSFLILGLLMPLAVYESKMQLLVLTYYKVLRWERALLALNTSTMLLALAGSAFAAYALDSVSAVVIAMVLAVVLRSIVGEYFLMRHIDGMGFSKSSISLLIVTISYGATTFLPNLGVAWAATALACGVHLAVNTGAIKQLLALRHRLGGTRIAPEVGAQTVSGCTRRWRRR